MKEEWKDIEKYKGLYQVSNLGRVKSINRIVKDSVGVNRKYKGKNLKPVKQKIGYFTVTLKGKIELIHRLVAITFIKNNKNKPQVNHIDGIKTNNNVNNLEWVTKKENGSHASINGLYKSSHGEKHYKSKLTDKQVKEIRSIKNKTQTEIAKLYNVDQSNISYILSNKTRIRNA